MKGSDLRVGDVLDFYGEGEHQITIESTYDGTAFGFYTKGRHIGARTMFPRDTETEGWRLVKRRDEHLCPTCGKAFVALLAILIGASSCAYTVIPLGMSTELTKQQRCERNPHDVRCNL